MVKDEDAENLNALPDSRSEGMVCYPEFGEGIAKGKLNPHGYNALKGRTGMHKARNQFVTQSLCFV